MEPFTTSVDLDTARSGSADPCKLNPNINFDLQLQDSNLALHENKRLSNGNLTSVQSVNNNSVKPSVVVAWLNRLALQFDSLPDATKTKSWGEAISTVFSAPIAAAGVFGTFAGLSIAAFQLIDKYNTSIDEQRKIQLSPVQVEMDVKTEILPVEKLIGDKKHKVVKVSIRARNKAPRDFTVLSTKWVAYAYKLELLPKEIAAKRSIKQECHDRKNCIGKLTPSYTNSKEWVALDGGKNNRIIIATGSLFSDNIIRPNEELFRQIILYMPTQGYHYAAFDVSMPVISRLHAKLLNDKSVQIGVAYETSDVSPITLYKCPLAVDVEGTDLSAKETGCSLLSDEKPRDGWTRILAKDEDKAALDLFTKYEFSQKIVAIYFFGLI